jgi:hypothetical protein
MNAPDRLDAVRVPEGMSKCVQLDGRARHTFAHAHLSPSRARAAPSRSQPPAPRRIYLTVDEKIPNAASYKCMREDHTIGHLLRM